MNFREHIEGIGWVHFVMHKRARNLVLSMRKASEVRMTIPYGYPIAEARKFLHSRKPWIQEQLAKHSFKTEGPNPNEAYRTRSTEIHLLADNRANGLLRLEGNRMEVRYPKELNWQDPFVQDLIFKAKTLVYEQEAKSYIPERIRMLAQKHGFQFRELSISKTKSKWGSCRSNGDIRISCHVMKLPEHLIDFILLHELCHTRFFNHGKEFHELLNHVTEGKENDYHQALKQYQIH